jgi:hypothetical protein
MKFAVLFSVMSGHAVGRYIPPFRRDLWDALSEWGKVKLPGVTSQKTAILIVTAIRNSRYINMQFTFCHRTQSARQ